MDTKTPENIQILPIFGNMETFSPRERLIIGTRTATENPSLAKSYLDDYTFQKQKALDTDPSNLNYYFLHFCRIYGLNTFDDLLSLLGAIYKQEKVDKRRLFVATILRMYKPQLFFSTFSIEIGIGQSLCNILRMDNGNMSKLIDEAKAWYCSKTDTDFRTTVDTLAQELRDIKLGYVNSIFKNVA